MAFDVMEDCIHLKACRRVQSIGRKHRLMVPRYCTEECTAYSSIDAIKREVEADIKWAFERGRDGNDWVNITSWDGFIDMLTGNE